MSKDKNTIHLTPNTLNKKLILPDGKYVFNGVIALEVKDGKPVPHGMVGCYHASDDKQYIVDTTGRAKAILSLFTDDIPTKIYQIMSKDLLPTEAEEDE